MATGFVHEVDRLRSAGLDLAWSLWTECGVSGWHRRAHADWSVELEPLIVLTAKLASSDPRLLRESVDWCVTNQRFVSLAQLRRVVTAERWPFKGEVARFGATVGVHTRARWPGVEDETPHSISLSGKSRSPDLGRPALLALRLRAAFGVSARAEIIRVLLTRPGEWSVRQIADRISYTQRQASSELDMLASSRLLHRSPGSRPARYRLTQPDAVAQLLGPLPRYAPPWAPTLRVLTGLLDAFDELLSTTLAVPAAELRRQMRHLESSVHRAGLSVPQPQPDRDYVEDLLAWSVRTFTAVAEGDPAVLGPDALVSPVGALGRPPAG